MNKVIANVLSFVRFQSMAASQSGVHLDPAVLHVGLVSKFDFATAPILLRSTMGPIALGLATKRGRVTMGHVQVGPLSLMLLSHQESRVAFSYPLVRLLCFFRALQPSACIHKSLQFTTKLSPILIGLN